MNPVHKALWYVESHSRDSITLEDIAKACHVSAYHLTRAFAAATGLSLMRYVRCRRLSDAACQLARGADDILAVALNAGYGSHEAFTRAFREQFVCTPEQVRLWGHVNNIQLVEPISMNSISMPDLAAPRFETLPARKFAGLVERYHCESPAGIPGQWQRFAPHLGTIPGQVGTVAYGICYNFDRESNFDYMCAVEIQGEPILPRGMTTISAAPQRYAVFLHPNHVAGIRSTWSAIWTNWFPESGEKAVEAPTFERYGKEFNPVTGLGGVEIWIPVDDRS